MLLPFGLAGWTKWLGVTLYPYGEVVGGNFDGDAFATYDRNATIGLDYARNRQYASGWGWFTSADPYQASAGLGRGQSWNRYAYVEGDPVNRVDKLGLFWCEVVGGEGNEDVSCIIEPGDLEGGAIEDQSGPLTKGVAVPDPEGVGRAKNALRDIANASFSGAECQKYLDAFAKAAGVTTAEIIKGIKTAATDALHYIYDGTQSCTTLNPTDYPATTATTGNTVAAWFADGNDGQPRYALSQYNGAAIYINGPLWTDNVLGRSVFSNNGTQNAYAKGTLLHELLHKSSLGGFDHEANLALFKSAWIDAVKADYALSGSSVFGKYWKECFH